MLHSPAFMFLMGSVPAETPVVPAVISISPAGPGDLGLSPQNWTAQIDAPGMAQVKWLVGVPGAKTIGVALDSANGVIPSYNHGDTINFTGYGSGFTLTRQGTTGNSFYAQGSNGNDTFTIPGETSVSDIRFTIDGAGGTGPATYTLLNLTNGKGSITTQFFRPGDRLIVKSVDEAAGSDSTPVIFSGVGVRSITLSPHDPGDLGTAPAQWTTHVNAVGINQIVYIVLDANWAGSGMDSLVLVDLVNGHATITCNFLKAGDRLVVKNVDQTVEDVSGQVSFSAVARSISLTPSSPGNLGVAPKPWTTEITTTGLAQVKWAVFHSDGTAEGNWTVQNIVNNKTSITCNFTRAGDALIVKSIDDLVQGFSSGVSFSSLPAETSGDYDFVRAFRARMTINVNLERDCAIGLDRAYYVRLKNRGISGVRLFIPSNSDYGYRSATTVDQFLDSAAAAMSAGLIVENLDFMDVCYPRHVEHSGAIPYLRMCGERTALRNFDPRLFACGPVNEWAAEWNEYYNPFRHSFNDALREKVGPNMILVSGGAYWKDPNTMVNGDMSLIPGRTIYEWHAYPWDAQDQWEADNLQTKLRAWEQANGVVAICGEYGKNQQEAYGNAGVNPSFIPAVIRACSRGLGEQRPNFWTITAMQWWRMNNQNNFDLTTEIGNATAEADTYVRTQPYFGI